MAAARPTRLAPADIEWASVERPGPTLAPEQMAARLRDRYIAARFPGLFRNAEDLRQTEYVVSVVRHLFEEGKVDAANELFALAIAQAPGDTTLRLAQLEIAFLARDAELYVRLARELREVAARIPEWKDVARLGHMLAPEEALFAGAESGERPHARYGPWPDTPNWIQASWDFTPEILSAQFHRAMSQRAA